MGRLRCNLLTLWYTLRYPKDGLLQGLILYGHDFIDTKKVHADHWVIKCKRCGLEAASEVQPHSKEKGSSGGS